MIPPFSPLALLSQGFSWIHRTHAFFRAAQKVATFSSSPVEMLLGSGMYVAVRDLEPVRVAAQGLLIARRTLHCITAAEKIQKIFTEIAGAMCKNCIPCRLIQERLLSRSPSWHMRQLIHIAPCWGIEIHHKLTLLIKKIIALFSSIICGAVSLIALLEATIPDEITAYEGILEIASSAHEVYEVFQQRAPQLVEAIYSHQPLIDHILSHTPLPIRCTDIMWCAQMAEPLLLADQKVSIIFKKILEIFSGGNPCLSEDECSWTHARGALLKNTLPLLKEYYYQ